MAHAQQVVRIVTNTMLPGRSLAAAIAVVLLSEAEGTPNKLVAGGGSVTVTGGPSKCEKQNRVKKGDFIGIHYTGTIDKSSKTGTPGSKFDSSFDNSSPFEEDANKEPQPFDFTIGNEEVIDGWDFGLLGLCKGAKATLVVPPELGYGDRGMGSDIPGGATINFAVEVMSVGDKPKDDDGLDPTPWPPEPAHEHEEEAEEAEEHEEGDAFEEQEVEDPTLQEHEDMGDPIDPNQVHYLFASLVFLPFVDIEHIMTHLDMGRRIRGGLKHTRRSWRPPLKRKTRELRGPSPRCWTIFIRILTPSGPSMRTKTTLTQKLNCSPK